ncbi:unknown [Clostridium sp. CAG:921]|nr:unknown [Clostridium sp. CAG:921]
MTLASTAIPIESINPAIPGKVRLIPVDDIISKLIATYVVSANTEIIPGNL